MSDVLYERAVALVQERQRANAAMLVRGLGIGYERAGRYIDKMEITGLISAPDESGVRTMSPGIVEAAPNRVPSRTFVNAVMPSGSLVLKPWGRETARPASHGTPT